MANSPSPIQGRLCVSVIEAKNVHGADMTMDLSFYVKLRVGRTEVRTDTSHGNANPKFLKDIRFPVSHPETDVLWVEMLQVAPRGDLVVGSAELPVATLVTQGTVVHWLDLAAFGSMGGSLGARLCLVLKYLSGDISRPLTPSFSIATRESRARSSSSGAEQLNAPQAIASKTLFSDSPMSLPATPAPVPAPVPAPSPASAPVPAPVAALRPVAVAAPLTPATPLPAAAPSPRQPTAPPLPKAQQPGVSSSPSPSLPRPSKKDPAPHLPLPVAIASGLLFGALTYLLRRAPSSTSAPWRDDGLCLVTSCYNEATYQRYKRRARMHFDDADE